MYVRRGSQLPVQMPEAECSVAVDPEDYAEMSSTSGQPACPSPVLQRGDSLQ